MTTATKTASAIRFILKDYNYWPGSEGDSPLTIRTSATELTNEKLIAIDRSLRRKANEGDASYSSFISLGRGKRKWLYNFNKRIKRV